MKPITKVIFGLGNPGAKYRNNRHNIGYMAVEALAEKSSALFKRKIKLTAFLTTIEIDANSVLLVKPNTFMNNSGVCVNKVLRTYGVAENNFLVVYDDIDLSPGMIRFREKGSCGGHRGMESIMESLGDDKVNRLRVGIGVSWRSGELADYVLSDFSKEEAGVINSVIEKAAKACVDWVKFDNRYVMQRYNRRRSD